MLPRLASATRPFLNLAELPEAIQHALSRCQQPCSVRELHRVLLEDYEVDFGLVMAVVVTQAARGQLQPVVTAPRSHA